MHLFYIYPDQPSLKFVFTGFFGENREKDLIENSFPDFEIRLGKKRNFGQKWSPLRKRPIKIVWSNYKSIAN